MEEVKRKIKQRKFKPIDDETFYGELVKILHKNVEPDTQTQETTVAKEPDTQAPKPTQMRDTTSFAQEPMKTDTLKGSRRKTELGDSTSVIRPDMPTATPEGDTSEISRSLRTALPQQFSKTPYSPFDGLNRQIESKIPPEFLGGALSKTPDFFSSQETKRTPVKLKPNEVKLFDLRDMPLPEEQSYLNKDGETVRDTTYSPLERTEIRLKDIERKLAPALEDYEKKIKVIDALHEQVLKEIDPKKRVKLTEEYNKLVSSLDLNSLEAYNNAIREYEKVRMSSLKDLKRYESLLKKYEDGSATNSDIQEMINIARRQNIHIQGADIGATGDFFRNVWNAVPQLLGGGIEGFGLLAHIMSNEEAKKPENINESDYIIKAGQYIKDKLSARTNPYYSTSGATHLAQGLGSSLAFAVSGGVGRLLKVPPLLSVGLPAGFAQAADAYNEAKSKTGDEEKATLAFFINFGLGMTEAIPYINLFNRLDKKTGGLLGNTFEKVIKSKVKREGVAQSIEEIIQETLNGFLSNLTAKEILSYDVERDLQQGLKEGAITGGTIGFFMGALMKKLQLAVEKGEISSEVANAKIKEIEKSLQSDAKRIPEQIDPAEGGTPPKLQTPTVSETPFKPSKKTDNDIYSLISKEIAHGKKRGMIVEVTHLEKLTDLISDPVIKEKSNKLIAEANEYNDRKQNPEKYPKQYPQFSEPHPTIESVSKKLYKKNPSELTPEEDKKVFDEYHKEKAQWEKNRKKWNKIQEERKEREKKQGKTTRGVYKPRIPQPLKNAAGIEDELTPQAQETLPEKRDTDALQVQAAESTLPEVKPISPSNVESQQIDAQQGQKADETPLAIEGTQQNDVINQVGEHLEVARKEGKLIDTNAVAGELMGVATDKNLNEINKILGEIDAHNNKLREQNTVSEDTLAKKKYNKKYDELNEDEKLVVNEELKATQEAGLTEFGKLETIPPFTKRVENVIQEQLPAKLPVQQKVEEGQGTIPEVVSETEGTQGEGKTEAKIGKTEGKEQDLGIPQHPVSTLSKASVVEDKEEGEGQSPITQEYTPEVRGQDAIAETQKIEEPIKQIDEKISEDKKQELRELINSEEELTDDEYLQFAENERRRAKGEYTKDGVVYKRKEVKDGIKGKSDEVIFTNDVAEKFTFEIIDADDMQPSHMGGQVNPYYFIPEAQHKRRVDETSQVVEAEIAKSPKMRLLADAPSAYDGAPIVNERNEVIQGNNRSAGIKLGYEEGFASPYKTMLIALLEEKPTVYGFTKEQIDEIKKMSKPVLVRKVRVSDKRAIELGNYSVSDKETGGKVRMEHSRVMPLMKVEDKIRILEKLFADKRKDDSLLNEEEESKPFTIKDAVKDNIWAIYGILSKYLPDNVRASMFDKNNRFTKKALEDVEEFVKFFLLQGKDYNLRSMFEDALSPLQQEGLYKALPYIFKAIDEKTHPSEQLKKTLLHEAQDAIEMVASFRQSKKAKAFDSWLIQQDAFKDNKAPIETYSKAAIGIARILAKAGTQKEIVRPFAIYAEYAAGTPEDLFREKTEGMPKEEAINKLLEELYGKNKIGDINELVKKTILQGTSEEAESLADNIRTITETITDKAETIVSEAKSGEEATLDKAAKDASEQINGIDNVEKNLIEILNAKLVETTERKVNPGQETKPTAQKEVTPEQEAKPITQQGETKAEKINKALAEADEEIANALKGFGKVFNKLPSEMLSVIMPIDPELVLAAGKVIKAYLKKGYYKFGQIINDLHAVYGEQLKGMYEALKRAYINEAKVLPENEATKIDDVETIENLTLTDIIGEKNEKQESKDRGLGKRNVGGGGDTAADTNRPQERPTGAGGTDRRIIVSEQDSIPEFNERVKAGDYNIDETQRFAVNLILHSFKEGFPRAEGQGKPAGGNKGFLLADGVGVGKTRELLVVAEEMRKETGGKVLIVTHSDNVLDQFRNEAKKLGIDLNNFEIGYYSQLGSGKIGKGEKYALAIYDEAHNLKNQETKKSGAAANVVADKVLYATATPMDTIEGSVYFIKNLMGIPDGEQLDRLYRRLGLRPETDGSSGGRQIYRLDKGATYQRVLEELIKIRKELVESGKYLRREYPFNGTINILHVEQPIEYEIKEKKISDFYAKRIAWARNNRRMDDEERAEIIKAYGLKRNFQIQRLNELAKLDAVVNSVLNDLKQRKRVVVFAEGVNPSELEGLTGEPNEIPGFISEFVHRITNAGYAVGEIYGDNIEAKTKEKNKFQKGEYQVVIGTPQSMSTGIDLDDQDGRYPRVAYIVTSNYSGNINEQMLGRISRRNTKSKAEVHYVVNYSLADAKRIAIVERKIKTLQAIQRGRISDEAALVSQMQQDALDKVEIEIEKLDDTRYKITGKTFGIKDTIKNELDGKWDATNAWWVIPSSKYDKALSLIKNEPETILFQKEKSTTQSETTWEKMTADEREGVIDELSRMVADDWESNFSDLSKDGAKGVTHLLDKVMSFDPKTADATTFWEEAFHQSTIALAKEEDAKKLLREAGWDGKGEIWETNKNKSLREAHEKLAEEFIDWVKKNKKPVTMKEKLFAGVRNLWNIIAKTLYNAGYVTKAGYFESLFSGDMKKAKMRKSRAREISIETQGILQTLKERLPQKLTRNQVVELLASGYINQADLSWNDVSGWVESQEGKIDRDELINYIRDSRLNPTSTTIESKSSGENHREITLKDSKGEEHSKVTTSDITENDSKILRVSAIEKQASTKGKGWKGNTLRNLIRSVAKEGYQSVIFEKDTLSDEDVKSLFRTALRWGTKFGEVEINGKKYYGIPINAQMQSLSIYEGSPIYFVEQSPMLDIAERIYQELKVKHGNIDVYGQWRDKMRGLNPDLTALETRQLWKKVRNGNRSVFNAKEYKEMKEKYSGVWSPITNEVIDNSDRLTFGEPKLFQVSAQGDTKGTPKSPVAEAMKAETLSKSPTVKAIKGDTLLKAGLRFFNEFITPPPVESELNSRFSPFYRIAEKYLNRNYIREQNKIIKEILHDFKDIRQLSEKDLRTLFDIISDYHEEQYYRLLEGYPTELLSLDGIIKKYKPNAEVQKALEDIHAVGVETLNLIKQGEKERLILFTKDISRFIKPKEFVEAFPEYWGLLDEDLVTNPVQKINELWNGNPVMRAKIADYLVEKKYEGWSDMFYLNLSRPLEANHYVVALHKSLPIYSKKEKIFTYFEKLDDATEYVKQMKEQGWEQTFNIYQVKDALESKEFINELSFADITKLVESVSSSVTIPPEIMDEFLKKAKEGYWDKHTIKRNYTPGMKWNIKELEQNLINQVAEASGRKNKLIGFALLDLELTKLEKEYQDALRKGSQKEVEGLRATLQYSKKFVSGIKLANSKLLDQIRGVMYLWDLGFYRPSFLVQQVTENIQTVMNLAIEQAGFVQGEKAFITSGKEAGELIFALIEEKMGKKHKLEGTELWDVISELRYMEKIAPLGVKVLMGESGDPKIHHDATERFGERLKNVLGSGGQAIEYATRLHTAATFYKIAKLKGINDKEAIVNYIADMIDLGKANYAKTGSIVALNPKEQPRINERTIGRMLSQTYIVYKKWAAANTGLYRLLWNRSKVAFLTKALVGVGLHGAKRFPIFYGLYGIASMIMGLFDEEPDKELQELEKKLNDATKGLKLGSLLNRGAGTYFGVDASKLFHESSALPTDLVADRLKNTESVRRLFSTSGLLIAETVLGRPYTFLEDIAVASATTVKPLFYDLSEAEKKEDTKHMALFLPSTFKGLVKAKAMEEGGVKVAGKTVMRPDQITEKDLAITRLTFTPESIAQKTEIVQAINSMVNKSAKKAVKELENGNIKKAELILHELWGEMNKIDPYTEYQIEHITSFTKFLNLFVFPRISDNNKEFLRYFTIR